MEIYIIFAISFAIMFWWNYTRQIIKTVQEVEKKLNDSEIKLNPIIYGSRMFLLSCLIMPWYFAAIISQDRWDYIKEKSCNLLKQQYILS